MRVLLSVVAAAALTMSTADAALTCPFDIQSRVASTLENPPTESASGSTDGTKAPSTGSSSGSKASSGSTDGSGDDAGSVPTDTPSETTAPPTTVPSTTTPSPDPQKETPSPTTVPPTPTTTAPTTRPTTRTTTAPATTKPTGERRFLQETTPADPSTNTTTAAPPSNSGDSSGIGSGSGTGGSTNTTIIDSFTCDETFYKQWDSLGLTCGGASIDVQQAVQAASCVIYSGTLGAIAGKSCVSMCAFPACVDGAWVYGGDNGISSDVYANVGIAQFISSDLIAGVAPRLTGSSVLTGNTTLVSSQQCAYGGDDSFSSCTCSKLVAGANKTDEQIKKERDSDVAKGLIPTDDTSKVGSVLAPTTSSIAGVAVFISAVAAVASSAVGTVSAASASVSAAGAGVGVWTIEICQFGVMLNQIQLEGKSAALSQFGKQMAPSAFTFLPFGKLDESAKSKSGTRRLDDNTSSNRGIAQYSRTLGIREDMLFLVTLAGVVVVMAGILGLFGIAYAVAGLFMSREDFMTKFFDKMIGVLVLVAILSQYTIGVTATYQIWYSMNILDKISDPKCILAIVSLVVLVFGTMLYGYIVVKRHEEDLRDVGTFTHVNKKVCHRYGPFYDEYKFKSRYFFAAKMMLALVSGVATGYVGAKAVYQVSIILAAHVIFFFYLEVQSPHHSRFVQTTTSFVTIMKIATLALTFFLISAATDAGLPSEVQNGVSLAIVGLNLFVLFLLMVRSLYAFWKKYQLQKDAKYDENDEQSAAQEYFKEETPGLKNNNQGGAKQNPYLLGGPNQQYDYSDNVDDMRVKSNSHLESSSKHRGSYEEAPPVRYDQISRNGAQHYIVNQPREQYAMNLQRESQQQQQVNQPAYAMNTREQAMMYQQRQAPPQREQFLMNPREQAVFNQRRNDVIEL